MYFYELAASDCMEWSSLSLQFPLQPLCFINLYLFRYSLLKAPERQQTESGVVQKAQRKVKKQVMKICVVYECLGKSQLYLHKLKI